MSDAKNTRPYAHVVDGKVVNVSIWDGVTDFGPVENAEMIPLATYTDDEGVEHYLGGIGWDYKKGKFVDNRPVEVFDEAE
jgi:hypothetical protein